MIVQILQFTPQEWMFGTVVSLIPLSMLMERAYLKNNRSFGRKQ